MTSFAKLDPYFIDPKDEARHSDLSVPIAFLRDLNKSKNRHEVLSTYSVWAVKMIKSDRSSIALDNGDGSYTIAALDGTAGIPKGLRNSIKKSVVGEVFRRKQVLCMPDQSKIDVPDVQIVANMGYNSSIMVPIISGDVCFGSLNASYIEPLDDPVPPLAMLQAMAGCLATQLLIVRQFEELETVARTDPLTGAFNRLHLKQYCDDLWVRWKEEGLGFSIIAADIDHFKSVNDTHGHDVGDNVLRHTAMRMQHQIRKDDALFRLGGEEFGVLLGGAPFNATMQVCERIHTAIRKTPFIVDNRCLDITASFGVCEVSPFDPDIRSVFKRADAALYTAKAKGRDCIVSG